MAWGIEFGIWVLLLAAFYTDVRRGIIPNRLTFSFLFLGIAGQFALGGPHLAWQALLAIVAGFALYIPLYAFGAVNAGDVKLLMALGAWMDTAAVVRLAIVSILVGAAVGLFVLIASGSTAAAVSSLRSHFNLSSSVKPGLKIPFAPAFFCAYVILKSLEMYR
jgi:prepilin peptidase CpaA